MAPRNVVFDASACIVVHLGVALETELLASIARAKWQDEVDFRVSSAQMAPVPRVLEGMPGFE